MYREISRMYSIEIVDETVLKEYWWNNGEYWLEWELE